MPTHTVVKYGIRLVLEGRQLFGPLSVRDNQLLGTYNASRERREQELQESLNRVYQLFQILHERSDQKAGILSGGEQQMLAIGRALMSKPNLLFIFFWLRGPHAVLFFLDVFYDDFIIVTVQ